MNQQSVSGPRFQPQWGTFCQRCCVEAPTRDVTFRQNIGALVVRFHSSTSGELCKSCIHAEFWRRTGITVAVGWLGHISLLVAPVFVVMNVYNYASAVTLLPPADGARTDDHDPAAMQRISEVMQAFVPRLNAGESPDIVLRDLGRAAKASPGQVRAWWRSVTNRSDRALAAGASA